MYKNILEVILVILLLVILCCCMVVKKHTYTLRILLALVILLTLLRVFYVSNREGFSDSLTLVDRNNLIDGDTKNCKIDNLRLLCPNCYLSFNGSFSKSKLFCK